MSKWSSKRSKKEQGVLLYLEEKNKQLDKKITNFDSFPEKIKVVLDKYFNFSTPS